MLVYNAKKALKHTAKHQLRWYNGLQKSGPEALEGDIIFRKVYSKDDIFIQEKFALETTFSSLRVANGKFTASLVNC